MITAKNHEHRLPRCYGIIPARYQSTRFPGKPLADILGKPMVRHVYERARQCAALAAVVVATDDHRIRSAAEKWDIPVVMTRKDHPSGTDRVLEAAEKLHFASDTIVVNVQGDEPALDPSMLTELLRTFSAPEVQVATLARKIEDRQAANPDQVKVVFAADGRALYFSRAPIPYHRQARQTDYFGHIGIYAFRMDALRQFVSLSPGRLEINERLEQLRLLENNIPIQIVLTEHRSLAVDRPEDIQTVSNLLLGEKNTKEKTP